MLPFKVRRCPSCVMVAVCPAIVSVPMRGVVDVFAVAANVTPPLPVPVVPAEMVIQDVVVEAVHAHVEAEAVTLIWLCPPEDGIDCAVADNVNVHGAGGGAGGGAGADAAA